MCTHTDYMVYSFVTFLTRTLRYTQYDLAYSLVYPFLISIKRQ